MMPNPLVHIKIFNTTVISSTIHTLARISHENHPSLKYPSQSISPVVHRFYFNVDCIQGETVLKEGLWTYETI